MSGYNKIVPELIDSSLWNETSDIRIVWITMIAVKDANGYVRGDAKTLARKANVPLEACQEALEKFQSPDPSSHTPDNEGRRIAPAPGGWLVLNHDLYREHGMSEDTKAYWREKKRQQRSREKGDVQDGSETVPGTVSEPYASASVSEDDSDSPEGSTEGRGGQFGSVSPTRSKTVLDIVKLAYSAFPVLTCPEYPPERERGNAGELVKRKHTIAQVQTVVDWVKAPKNGDKPPQSPLNLLDPDRFNQWLVMAEKSKNHSEHSPTAKKPSVWELKQLIEAKTSAMGKLAADKPSGTSVETQAELARWKETESGKRWLALKLEIEKLKEQLAHS